MPTCFSSVAAKTFYLLITLKHKRNPVADPGFSGGAPTPKVGVLTYFFVTCVQLYNTMSGDHQWLGILILSMATESGCKWWDKECATLRFDRCIYYMYCEPLTFYVHTRSDFYQW